MRRLKVLTLNIWHREQAWEQRRELIRLGLRRLEPDIVGLQEVLELDMGGQRRDQAQEIARELGYHVCFGGAQSLGTGLTFGNALMTRHELAEHQVFPLPGGHRTESRSLLYARVVTPWAEVPCFVTHLNWKLHHGSVRLRQLDRVIEVIGELAPIGKTYPPILMGDLNAEPESDEIRYLRGFATRDGRSVFFADAWSYGGADNPGFTFDRRNPNAARSHEPPRRIDYIFVRGPDRKWRGEPMHTRVVFDEPHDGIWASDHFGVYSEISI